MHSKYSISKYQRYFGILSIILASFFWGTRGTVTSESSDISPINIGVFAMLCGGLLLFLCNVNHILSNKKTIKKHIFNVLIAAFAVEISPISFFTAIHFSTISISTIIASGTTPLFSKILEYFFDKKPLSFKWAISFIFGMIGIVFICLSTKREYSSGLDNNIIKGIIFGAIAAFTYAIYSWNTKKLILNDINNKAIMGSIFFFGSLIQIPIFFKLTLNNNLNIMGNEFVLIYMVLIPAFLAYILYNYGLKSISPSTAVTLNMFEPLVGTGLAVIFAGERLNLLGWIGFILVLICLYLSSKSESN